MSIASFKSGLTGLASAGLASLCCVLPLALLLTGIGSGAFMLTFMSYSYIFLPIGLLGVALGWFLFFRQRKSCAGLACRRVRSRWNLLGLIFSSALVLTALAFNLFPEAIAPLLSGQQ